MNSERAPKTLNWVKVRAGCSIEQMFLLLAQVVDSDAQAMADVARRGFNFEFQKLSEDRFSVTRHRNLGGLLEGDAVVFVRNDQGVTVSDGRSSAVIVTAKPAVDANGECRFEVAGKPVELWQVSRLALEDFFFGSTWPPPTATRR